MKEKIESKEEKIEYKKIFSSCHINFLFGSGVNGKAFPQTKGFVKTNKMLENVDGKSFEDKLNNLENKDQEKVIEQYCNEFNEFWKYNFDKENESITNIKSMLSNINKIINNSENRTIDMKKINIFTLNYDEIIEGILDELGFFKIIITAKKMQSLSRMSTIGFNLDTERYIPTYCVTKLHGTSIQGEIQKENIIYPGLEKYSKVLSSDFFQVLIKMKSELFKNNSLLIVIGYSGFDDHINSIIKEANNNGLTVIWVIWDIQNFTKNKDYFCKNISENIFFLCSNESEIDSTLFLSHLIIKEVF